MEETLMTLCGDSIKLIESITIFFGFILMIEYRGKKIKIGFAMQVLFFYVFQELSLWISLYFTDSATTSSIFNIMILVAIGCICYKGSVIRKIGALLLYEQFYRKA